MNRFLLQTDDGDHFRLEDPKKYNADPDDRFVDLTDQELAEYKEAFAVMVRYQRRFREIAS
jgi:hypothetical protein